MVLFNMKLSPALPPISTKGYPSPVAPARKFFSATKVYLPVDTVCSTSGGLITVEASARTTTWHLESRQLGEPDLAVAWAKPVSDSGPPLSHQK